MDEGIEIYTAQSAIYIALIIGFVLVIVLQAWFVRRVSTLKERARDTKNLWQRLRNEATELAQRSAEMKRGISNNVASTEHIRAEIEATKSSIRSFLEEHEELREEFSELAAEASKTVGVDEAAPAPEGDGLTETADEALK